VRLRWVRIAALAFAIALATGVALGAATGDSNGGAYEVRAIFDNASFIIPGEDVKVAGVKVGTIDDLELTKDNKAAVVLRIDDPAFVPFRADGHCRIALQSLIGEQFVECVPTVQRGEGVAPARELAAIPEGQPGEGQHLLPVSQTQTPVGIDLIQNIMRLPERQRFRLIINELGAGLAGNGENLRAALRRANPALQQTDRVIAILARQDRVLARLVDESDAVLAPLARRRKALGGFIEHSGKVAVATAAEGDALEESFKKLPGFLRVLQSSTDDFSALADQMTPALQSLDSRSAAINKTVAELGPTADLGTPALVSLGKAADVGIESFPSLDPSLNSLRGLAKPLKPLSANLAALSSSFDDTGGIEQVMKFIYNYTASVNGEDVLGHYIRGALQVTVCSGRVSAPAPGCNANFPASSASASAASQQLLDFLLGGDKP
jgi:phospholipid/cholesterol/gamma-HCH transport system substrate-binding protein